ncbi:MAG: DUF3562 domain-containing protein [Moraxellaceae bacterium]
MKPQAENRPTRSDDDSLRAIAHLAGVTEEMVRAQHLEATLHLENGACIRDFIPLLALKHVRETFRPAADTPHTASTTKNAPAAALMLTEYVAPV